MSECIHSMRLFFGDPVRYQLELWIGLMLINIKNSHHGFAVPLLFLKPF